MFSADLTGKEIAEVGFFDLQDDDRFYPIGETSAWNCRWAASCNGCRAEPGIN